MMIPGFGFLVFPPTDTRPYWLTMTHGLAQPTEREEYDEGAAGGVSGFGLELGFATPDDDASAARILEMVASYLVQSERPFSSGDRLPSSDLMTAPGGGLMIMCEPPEADEIETASGTFVVAMLLGITGAELDRAKSLPGRQGSAVLEKVLDAVGVGCVTDRARPCATLDDRFDSLWAQHLPS